MSMESLKGGVDFLKDNLAEGWRHLTRSAAGALTRFRAGEKTDMPSKASVDDALWLPNRSWAMLGGDVFEDDKHLIVRLEVPGMEKQDMTIEAHDDALVVYGEKRFEQEKTEGRWRVMQCAYGSFHRVIPLSAPVVAEKARATYKNGVLRIELPKATPSEPHQAITIKVE